MTSESDVPRAAPTGIRENVALDLALQGGGAHGAFTWGVLHRLLDEEWLSIDGVSGASAGAMNAVMLAHGLVTGDRRKAQDTLDAFWRRVAAAAQTPFGAVKQGLSEKAAYWNNLPWMTPWLSPTAGLEAASKVFAELFSPYQFNPLNLNPLLDILREMVDFEALRRTDKLKLFISATRVADGELRLFRNAELSAEAVMASACLPELFQAVEIDGVAYWDGGYVANPALEPLIAETYADDLLLIQLNPRARAELPKTATEIAGRLNEITFNANLNLSMHAIAQLKILLSEESRTGELQSAFFRELQKLRLHRIAADETAFKPDAASKRDPRLEFLLNLREQGARAADAWLAQHGGCIGNMSTLDCRML